MTTSKSKTCFLTFIVLTIVLFAIKAYQYPSLVIHPEINSDGGLNFLNFAINAGIHFGVITQQDAGYLPLFQRLISMGAYHLFGRGSILFFYTVLPVLLVSLFAAVIVLKEFEQFIPSLAQRTVLAFCIGVYPEYYSHFLENFSLFLTPFLFWLFLIEKNKLKPLLFWFICITHFVIVISKLQVLSVMPIYALYFLFTLIKTKTWSRQLTYILSGLVGGLTQTLYFGDTLMHHQFWTPSTLTPSESIHNVLKILQLMLSKSMYMNPGSSFAYVSYAIIAFCIYLYFSKKSYNLKFITALILIGLINVFLGSREIGPHSIEGTIYHRYIIITNTCFVFLIFYLTSKAPRILSILISALIFTSATAVAFNKSLDTYRDKRYNFSNWRAYKEITRRPEYCLPINAGLEAFWMIPHFCTTLNTTVTSRFENLKSLGFKSISSDTYRTQELHYHDVQGIFIYMNSAESERPEVAAVLNNGSKVILPLLTPPGYFWNYYVSDTLLRDVKYIEVAQKDGGASSINFERTILVGNP